MTGQLTWRQKEQEEEKRSKSNATFDTIRKILDEQLIKEGMPIEEIHHMCDVHLAVLQETLQED